MSEFSVFDRAEALSASTPLSRRLARGIVWAWSIAAGFAAVMLVRALVVGGISGAHDIARALGPFTVIALSVMTSAGIAAAFVVPLLTGYSRACFLGLLVVLPLLLLMLGSNDDAGWRVGPWDVYTWLVSGAGLGALLRWRRGRQGWPVGDDWP